MRMVGLVCALVLTVGCSAVVSTDESRLGPRPGGDDAGGGGRDAGTGTDAGGGVDAGRTDDGGGGDTDAGGGTCTPGSTDTVDCGMCGTAERTCSAAGTWEMGACEGEGVCMAGEPVSIACGVDGSVEGTCTASCEMPELTCPLDVMLLLDRTGSHNATINGNIANIMSGLVDPLLAAGDVHIGISVFADFPYGSFGRDTDRPFIGVLEPTADSATISTELSSLPSMNGGDYPEGGVEALFDLSGGDPHYSSRPFDCSGDRVHGGCWRRNAERAIVIVTDVSQHNIPSPTIGGALVSPYPADLGAPAWDDVHPLMTGGDIALFGLVRDRGTDVNDGSRQLRAVATALGDDPDLRIVDYATGGGEVPSLGPQLRQLETLIADTYFP